MGGAAGENRGVETEPGAIDLNFDGGEGYDDASLAPFATTVHAACGGHAGDDSTMRETVALALRHRLSLGAHPSYPDRAGFGRRRLDLPPDAVAAEAAAQVVALRTAAAALGTVVTSVKPHGALYHAAAREPLLARALCAALAEIDPGLVVVGPAGSLLEDSSREAGLGFAAEAFADRCYLADGTLVPRSSPRALVTSPLEAAAQAVALARDGVVRAIDGSAVRVRSRTICLHGDTPGAAGNAAAVRRALDAAGIRVRPFA